MLRLRVIRRKLREPEEPIERSALLDSIDLLLYRALVGNRDRLYGAIADISGSRIGP